MSCGCSQTPCTCSSGVSVTPITTCNQTPCTCGGCGCGDPLSPPVTTLCDLDRRNNVWVEGPVDSNGNGGICLLDTLDECSVINSLQRSQRAKDDLKRVTSNEFLRNLADTVPLLPTTNEGDTLQKEINQNSIPFYSVFRGQPPFAQ